MCVRWPQLREGAWAWRRSPSSSRRSPSPQSPRRQTLYRSPNRKVPAAAARTAISRPARTACRRGARRARCLAPLPEVVIASFFRFLECQPPDQPPDQKNIVEAWRPASNRPFRDGHHISRSQSPVYRCIGWVECMCNWVDLIWKGELRCARSACLPFVPSAAQRCVQRHAGHVTERLHLGLQFARSAAAKVNYSCVQIGHAILRRQPITGAVHRGNSVIHSVADTTRNSAIPRTASTLL